MSERLFRRAVVSVAAISACAVSASCSFESPYESAPVLERCFDQPQPFTEPEPTPEYPRLPKDGPIPKQQPGEDDLHYSDRLDKWIKHYNRSQQAYDEAVDDWNTAAFGETLSVPVKDGYPVGKRVFARDSTISKASRALVEISTPDWTGTGFVVEQGQQQYVVTAAHVMGTAKLDKLTFTDQHDKQSHPTGGCYLYERRGKFIPVPEGTEEVHKIADVDLAVFSVEGTVSKHPLELAPVQPKPGDVIDFVNYQDAYGPTDFYEGGDNLYDTPASYTGIVVPNNSNAQYLNAITGAYDVGENMTVGDFAATHIVGGASGGPVFNSKGRVIGESFAGTSSDIFLSKATLSVVYGVKFPGAKIGDKTGFEPTVASIVPSEIIEKAIKSADTNQ